MPLGVGILAFRTIERMASSGVTANIFYQNFVVDTWMIFMNMPISMGFQILIFFIIFLLEPMIFIWNSQTI